MKVPTQSTFAGLWLSWKDLIFRVRIKLQFSIPQSLATIQTNALSLEGL